MIPASHPSTGYILRYLFFIGVCVYIGWLSGMPLIAFSLSLGVALVDLLWQIHMRFRAVLGKKIDLAKPPDIAKNRSLIANSTLDEMVFYLQHLAYEQRKKTQKSTNELRLLYNMLNKLSYGLVITDRDGIIHWTNSYARDLLGLRKSDQQSMLTMFVRTPAFVRFFDSQHYSELCVFTLTGNYAVVETERLKFGSRRDIFLFRNITQQEQKQQMHKRFLADASHEMQSPLTVIRGCTELALEQAKPKQRGHLEEVVRQVDNMSGLMRSLMILARIDESRVPENPGWIEPAHTIRLAGQMAARELGSDMAIEYHIVPGLEVWCNQNDLFIIVRNLIHNALKHSRSDAPVQVRWSLHHWKQSQQKKRYAIIEVRDSGTGMSEEQIQKIGKRFYQLASNQTDNGYGLGLSIVKGLLRLYKGRLIIQSTPGAGSAFYCVLNAKYTRARGAESPRLLPQLLPGAGVKDPRPCGIKSTGVAPAKSTGRAKSRGKKTP